MPVPSDGEQFFHSKSNHLWMTAFISRSWMVNIMKSMLFCLIGAAVGTGALMAADTAALSSPAKVSRIDAIQTANYASTDLGAAAQAGSTDRKIRIVYPGLISR